MERRGWEKSTRTYSDVHVHGAPGYGVGRPTRGWPPRSELQMVSVSLIFFYRSTPVRGLGPSVGDGLQRRSEVSFGKVAWA